MIRSHVCLRELNTLHLDSTAEWLGEYDSVTELYELARFARRKKRPLIALGGGSNVLCEPFVAAVLVRSRNEQVTLLGGDSETCRVSVGAGLDWHQWVERSVTLGHGLENLAWIPGTVGAAPVQNIGAYGVEVAQFIDSVVAFLPGCEQLVRLSAADCRFGYRDSVFKRELKDAVIVRVIFRLQRHFCPVLDYGPLVSWQKQAGGAVSPQSLIAEVIRIRQQRLPDPAVIANAGSFFKNPVVPQGQAQDLKARYPDMPVYPVDDSRVKLAAGWLIEQVGWKGRSDNCDGSRCSTGTVAMHDRQALVLVNLGGATLADVDRLTRRVQQDVAGLFGVALEPEPQRLV